MTAKPWEEDIERLWSESDGNRVFFARKIRKAALEEACKTQCPHCRSGEPLIVLSQCKHSDWKFGHGETGTPNDYKTRCSAHRIQALIGEE